MTYEPPVPMNGSARTDGAPSPAAALVLGAAVDLFGPDTEAFEWPEERGEERQAE